MERRENDYDEVDVANSRLFPFQGCTMAARLAIIKGCYYNMLE